MMGHTYREIKGTEQIIAWRVSDIVKYVTRHTDVPDVLKTFVDKGVLTVIGHTNGTVTIAVVTPGETQGELNRDDVLMVRDESLAVMAGWQFRNQWTEIETWVDSEIADRIVQFAQGPATPDNVNHPSHYTRGKIEVWDFIIDQDLNYLIGNVVKYVCRAGEKDPAKHIEDLEKAKAYLNREIKRVQEKHERQQ